MNERADSCGIYLVLPSDEAPALRNSLEEILQGGRIACVLLESGAQGGGDPALARELCALTQAHDVAFLVQDDLEAVTAAGADGIHVTGGEEAYAQARRQLGAEAIVGVACATQRHTALVVAE
ncbi:MAG: thiamine phosphate synthase, partial [Alphaproteobacteria bacterium]